MKFTEPTTWLNAKPGQAEKRTAIILSAAFLAACLGCASFQFGGHNESTQSSPSDDRTISQSGNGSLRGGEEVDVYYPVPFVSPPNLVVQDSFNRVLVTEQRPDHFHVKATTGSDFTWKARGMPIPAAPAQPTPGQPPDH